MQTMRGWTRPAWRLRTAGRSGRRCLHALTPCCIYGKVRAGRPRRRQAVPLRNRSSSISLGCRRTPECLKELWTRSRCRCREDSADARCTARRCHPVQIGHSSCMVRANERSINSTSAPLETFAFDPDLSYRAHATAPWLTHLPECNPGSPILPRSVSNPAPRAPPGPRGIFFSGV